MNKDYALGNWLYLIAIFVLTLVGILVYYSLTMASYGWSVILEQLVLIIVGWLVFYLSSRLDYRFLKTLPWVLYGAVIIMMILVLLVGKSEFGARRWLDLGIVNFQPSEIGKLVMVCVLAKFFCDVGDKIEWLDVAKSMLLALLPAILVYFQPDLGSALVFMVIWLVMLVGSQVDRAKLLILFFSFLLALPVSWLFMRDYQKERIMTFLNPALDPYGSGYNVLQSQIAVGSGGWYGLGLAKGWQSQLHFLPVAYSDFAFAVFAEEFGFIGGILILVLFGYIIWKCWQIAYRASDQYGYFLALGIGGMIFFQVFVNVGMNIGVLPVTGIPLPLISSGGTSILTTFAMLGLTWSVQGKMIS